MKENLTVQEQVKNSFTGPRRVYHRFVFLSFLELDFRLHHRLNICRYIGWFDNLTNVSTNIEMAVLSARLRLIQY